MGKARGRRARHNQKQEKDNKDQYKQDDRDIYPFTLVKSKKEFEEYYKAQKIVPEGEWEDFMNHLREPLPSTFRITGFKRESQQMLSMIKSEYFDNLVNVEIEGRNIDPPKCLPWYPSELAWQLDLDRKIIRQSDTLKTLHKFLVQETESGNISRQEAVSMIPPLVMDIQPHHKVLDMCAAPGSKTAQLIEMLHADDAIPVPDGVVVANDSDNKRCYLMTHQVKRLASPSFVIINQDASCMPNLKVPAENDTLKSMKFDRVLADVPCSGDGTLRKNIDAWGKWNVFNGMHLHNIQSRILNRGLEMLDVGGRLVYSTCALNPIEDEAVVSNLLRKAKGAVKLLDVSALLPGLKFEPGLSTWKVMSRELEEFNTFEELPERLRSTIRPSVFPPSEDEVKQFQLDRCMRILPHHQNTGGFFICAMEKVDEVPWVKHFWTERKPRKGDKEVISPAEGVPDLPEGAPGQQPDPSIPGAAEGEAATPATTQTADEQTEGDGKTQEVAQSADNTAPGETKAEKEEGKGHEDAGHDAPGKRHRDRRSDSPDPKRKKRMFGYKEDPFIFFTEQEPVWPSIKEFYGLKDFPVGQLLVRCSEGKKRNIYFTSHIVKTIVDNNEGRIKIINLGLKILSRSDSPHVTCNFRTVQDGVSILYPYLTERMVQIPKEDIVTLLSSEMPFLSRFSRASQNQLDRYTQGSIVFTFDPSTDSRPDSPKCPLILCGWLGRTSCRSFIPLGERGHFLRLCGVELRLKDDKPGETTTGADADAKAVEPNENEVLGVEVGEQTKNMGSEVNETEADIPLQTNAVITISNDKQEENSANAKAPIATNTDIQMCDSNTETTEQSASTTPQNTKVVEKSFL